MLKCNVIFYSEPVIIGIRINVLFQMGLARYLKSFPRVQELLFTTIQITFVLLQLLQMALFIANDYLYSLWNPEVQCRIHKGFPIIPILGPIIPIPPINTYFFNQSSAYDLIPRHAVAVMHRGQ